ncbi:hypothetical protein KSS87_005034 [Heliosperma pusillum]|nr:hypothetical protein KSS87_005034 [Heliosperma pusillum]
MCHQNSRPSINAEEAIAAEECLLIYCKPVELYNILQRRAQYNPPFLSRSLNYKIEAKWKTRLMDQNVIFNYRDQNNLLRKTEITRHFTCPFCLVRCGSFKGLRFHLSTSHDLFKCEFWTSEEYKAVNVSVRTDTLCSETSASETEPQMQSFSYCSRPRKRIRPEDPLEKGKHVYPHVLESALTPLGTNRLHNDPLDSNEGGKVPRDLHSSRLQGESCCSFENAVSNGTSCVVGNGNQGVPVARAQSVEDIECSHNMSVERSLTTSLLPHAKSRKLSSDRTDSRSSMLLQKRQFYHSHRSQPMGLEQVMADRDSEDEADHDITALEDRRMLDDFVDVSRDEKHLMHLWNSFVRKQRVLADGHVPWACEAFLQLHGKSLVQSSALFWCWRLFMVKLWNHGLLDAVTMNNCSMILQKYQDDITSDGVCSNTCKPEPMVE